MAPEMRGVWLATVSNLDWPSRPGLAVAVQQREFRDLLNQVQILHLNTVVVQVRPMGDAFYPSHDMPWSQYLMGQQGQSPGYDPLAFMITEAHQRGLSFHAWFNPYRVSQHGNIAALAANNPARLHPDWIVHYGGALYYNPGIPEVRAAIINSIMEVVQHYAVDAVQFDDYFYPYPVAGLAFPDAATYRRYGAGHFASLADWRRVNVNQLIHEVFLRIKQVRPGVQFGISPFGVWRNQSTDATGSHTRAGVTDYDILYADTRTWIRRHWIDYIVPQLYWHIGFAPADYQTLLAWWAHEVAGYHVRLYIGQAAYTFGRNSPTSSPPAELLKQLALNRRYPQIQGSIFFRLKNLLRLAPELKEQLAHYF
ncbi:hypothetical protein KDI_00470 [Dictyobacter arantiisoli]|uniref:Glycosyl hydrolase-like 10 domain-containing protein n=1 Tax=Dictyobacter arantiisoli TaxID=2014874 RepID=A0A5A5T640_9CHLR|nr:hypothetical protein KDI_00470 [Dictyobacter arantiisoli]